MSAEMMGEIARQGECLPPEAEVTARSRCRLMRSRDSPFLSAGGYSHEVADSILAPPAMPRRRLQVDASRYRHDDAPQKFWLGG